MAKRLYLISHGNSDGLIEGAGNTVLRKILRISWDPSEEKSMTDYQHLQQV